MSVSQLNFSLKVCFIEDGANFETTKTNSGWLSEVEVQVTDYSRVKDDFNGCGVWGQPRMFTVIWAVILQLIVWMIDHCVTNMQNVCQTNMVITYAIATMDIMETAVFAHVRHVQ